METSPRRRWLYRTAVLAVTLLASLPVLAQGTITQYGRKTNVSKGPRALGLIQLFPNGKAHLIPVSVMMDGKFFDAASYKATPVPMALDFGVVYEGFSTGVSKGLFTVTQPGQAGQDWMGEGTWLPAGATPPRKGMKYEKPKDEDPDAPPRLHRGDKATPPAEKPPTPPPPAAKAPERAKVQEPDAPIEDPNRPVLRRGKPDPEAHRELVKKFEEAESGKLLAGVQVFPAISDTGGPDARPYKLDLQPGEEETYRKKMLDLAASELRSKAGAPQPIGARPVRKGAAATKVVAPAFDDVHLRIFDLTNSNEPILVLSAKTRPDAKTPDGEEITLVARTNLELEVQKLFFSKTDSRHLYVAPRMELIDAVDADGDGRGDLLFRTTTDAGSSYAIYRLTVDRLWPLYEGTP